MNDKTDNLTDEERNLIEKHREKKRQADEELERRKAEEKRKADERKKEIEAERLKRNNFLLEGLKVLEANYPNEWTTVKDDDGQLKIVMVDHERYEIWCDYHMVPQSNSFSRSTNKGLKYQYSAQGVCNNRYYKYIMTVAAKMYEDLSIRKEKVRAEVRRKSLIEDTLHELEGMYGSRAKSITHKKDWINHRPGKVEPIRVDRYEIDLKNGIRVTLSSRRDDNDAILTSIRGVSFGNLQQAEVAHVINELAEIKQEES